MQCKGKLNRHCKCTIGHFAFFSPLYNKLYHSHLFLFIVTIAVWHFVVHCSIFGMQVKMHLLQTWLFEFRVLFLPVAMSSPVLCVVHAQSLVLFIQGCALLCVIIRWPLLSVIQYQRFLYYKKLFVYNYCS